MFSKRTKAFLLACALFSGALVSCGEDEESSSGGTSAATKNTEKASVSETVTTAEKTTEASTGSGTEATAEASTEASTEEKTTAETVSEPASEEETTLATEAPSAEVSPIVGRWMAPYTLTETIYEFSSDGTVTEIVDFTPYFSYSGDKGRALGAEADVTFDGKFVRFIVDGKEGEVFEKISSEDGIDGTYKEYPEDLYAPTETFVLNGGNITKYTKGTYTIYGNDLTEVFPGHYGNITRNYKFTVEGDELRLNDEYGEERLTRAE